MVRNLLICGMIAGICGGILATGFAYTVGEPAVDQAISFERARDAALGTPGDAPIVSRHVQRTFGLTTAMLTYGLALGGIFAIVFSVVYGRVGRASPRKTSAQLASTAWVVIYFVPLIKYPPNPPSIGDPNTISSRTVLYVTLIAISVAAAVAAYRLRKVYARRWSSDVATGVAIASYIAIVVVAGLILPSVHETPKGFPADTLWRFREASIGIQAIMWTTIGVGFGALASRVLAGQSIIPRREREAPSDTALARVRTITTREEPSDR